MIQPALHQLMCSHEHSKELLDRCVWPLEKGRGTEGGQDRDTDTGRCGRRRLRWCRHRRAGTRRGCAFLLPQYFLFSVKTGPQRRCKYRSAMPRISGKPASKKQPSCSSSRCVQIHRKQNLQHILMWLNARSKRHLEILLASLSAWGRSCMPRTLNH